MAGPNKTYRDYRNSMPLIDARHAGPARSRGPAGDHAMITIVDYGLGNIRAFLNIYKRLNIEATTATTADDCRARRSSSCPASAPSITRWSSSNGRACARRSTTWCSSERVPVLGVCVGMQMLGASQRRGRAAGPGLDRRPRSSASSSLIRGDAARAAHGLERRASRAGPQALRRARLGCALLLPALLLLRTATRRRTSLAVSNYGSEFACAVNAANVFGVQFHPEKSHRCGTQLLKNFAEL